MMFTYTVEDVIGGLLFLLFTASFGFIWACNKVEQWKRNRAKPKEHS